MAVGFGNGAVGMQEGAVTKPTAASIGKVVAAARKKEYASYEKYGALADVKEAVQAATMWNYIYTPAEYGSAKHFFIIFVYIHMYIYNYPYQRLVSLDDYDRVVLSWDLRCILTIYFMLMCIISDTISLNSQSFFQRPFLPVSRQWNFVQGGVNLDWAYVIFDWDNIFATYMTSLDAKEIAYSNFIQVIRSRTSGNPYPSSHVPP